MNGSDIRRIRKEILKCSMEKLAKALGVSTITIFNWEKGKSNPSPLARDKLSEIFKKMGRRFGELSMNETDRIGFNLQYDSRDDAQLCFLPAQLMLPLKMRQDRRIR